MSKTNRPVLNRLELIGYLTDTVTKAVVVVDGDDRPVGWDAELIRCAAMTLAVAVQFAARSGEADE